MSTLRNAIERIKNLESERKNLLLEIEELKKMAGTEAALKFMESIVETVREPLVVLDNRLHVVSANHAFYKYFKTAPAKTEGRPLHEMGDGNWEGAALKKRLDAIIERDDALENFEVELTLNKLGKRRIVLNGRRLKHKGISQPLILLAMQEAAE